MLLTVNPDLTTKSSSSQNHKSLGDDTYLCYTITMLNYNVIATMNLYILICIKLIKDALAVELSEGTITVI